VVQLQYQLILDNQQFYKNFSVLIIKHLHLVKDIFIIKINVLLFVFLLSS
jgi:hypothetical protein